MNLWLGPAGAPSNSGSTEQGVHEVAKLGLNAMEVEFVYGVKMGLETAKRIGAVAAEKKNKIKHSRALLHKSSSAGQIKT